MNMLSFGKWGLGIARCFQTGGWCFSGLIDKSVFFFLLCSFFSFSIGRDLEFLRKEKKNKKEKKTWGRKNVL